MPSNVLNCCTREAAQDITSTYITFLACSKQIYHKGIQGHHRSCNLLQCKRGAASISSWSSSCLICVGARKKSRTNLSVYVCPRAEGILLADCIIVLLDFWQKKGTTEVPLPKSKNSLCREVCEQSVPWSEKIMNSRHSGLN